MITQDNYIEHLSKLQNKDIVFIFYTIKDLVSEDKTELLSLYFDYYNKYVENNEDKKELIKEITTEISKDSNKKKLKKLIEIIDKFYKIFSDEDDDITITTELKAFYFKKDNELIIKMKEYVKIELLKINNIDILLALLFNILNYYFNEDITNYYITYKKKENDKEKIEYLQEQIIEFINKITYSLFNEYYFIDFIINFNQFKDEVKYTYFTKYLDKLKDLFGINIISLLNKNDKLLLLFYIYKISNPDYLDEFINHSLSLLMNNTNNVNIELLDIINKLNEEQLYDIINKYKNSKDTNKSIEEEFGSYKTIFIDEILKEVQDITDMEFLLTIIFKVMLLSGNPTIIHDFTQLKTKTSIASLIAVITSPFLEVMRDSDLGIILNNIKKVKVGFSELSSRSYSNVCNKKKEILNKHLLNYNKELNTIRINDEFNKEILKIKDEELLKRIIYYILKHCIKDGELSYIHTFLFYMEELYEGTITSLNDVITKKLYLRMNTLSLTTIIDMIRNKSLPDYKSDLKKNYSYISYLLIKHFSHNLNEDILFLLIKALNFDYIRIVNPNIEDIEEISHKFEYICNLYQSILKDDDLILNSNFKKRIQTLIDKVIEVLETVDLNVDRNEDKINEIAKLKGIPLIYCFYNLVYSIVDRSTIINILLSFINRNTHFKNRYIKSLNEDMIDVNIKDVIDILQYSNMLSDTLYGDFTVRQIYEMLLDQENILELKKILMQIIYIKYTKKEISNTAIIRLMNRIA